MRTSNETLSYAFIVNSLYPLKIIFQMIKKISLGTKYYKSNKWQMLGQGDFKAILQLPWVPEVFFSLGATELSGEAARKKPLAPTDNNLTSMPTPVSFD